MTIVNYPPSSFFTTEVSRSLTEFHGVIL